MLRRLTIILVVGLLATSPTSRVHAIQHHFTTFTAPHAGTSLGQGTTASGINQRGDISGTYVDRKGVEHGFLLHQGHFTTLDYPKAARTQAFGINQQGDIVGNYTTGRVTNGFLLHQGHYTSLHDPVAGTTAPTFANGISALGDIVGQYFDLKGVSHGFLLHQGRYTTLDHPRAGTKSGWTGTYPNGINQQGDIVGSYVDSMGARHGYLLHQGHFTTLNAPGSAAPRGTGGSGTIAAGINQQGVVVGTYFDRNTLLHGFLLNHGTYAQIDHPKAATGSIPGEEPRSGTMAWGINPQGQIVGTYGDSKGVQHGFLWQ